MKKNEFKNAFQTELFNMNKCIMSLKELNQTLVKIHVHFAKHL